MSGEVKPKQHMFGELGPELVLRRPKSFVDELCRLEVEGFTQLWVLRAGHE